MRKFLYLILLIIASLFLLTACAEEEKELVKIMVTADSGATVKSENPIEVEIGSDCEFEIEIGSTSLFLSATDGEFDPDTGKLTLKNVTERTNVIFKTEDVGYSTTEKVIYIFSGASGDKTSIKSLSKIRYGTSITLEAKNSSGIFAGWTYGMPLENGGTLISTERKHTFKVVPDMVTGSAVRVFANYKNTNILYYNANGGIVDSSTQNMSTSEFYAAEVNGESVKITLSERFLNFSECANAFWNDGTFKREGYVLVEYNTKADGSGEAYGLGSKVYTMNGNDNTTLYCVWEKVSEGFEYADFTFARPEDMKLAHSPEWNETGVIITRYNGDESKVVVPEVIDGKPVIAIAADAFVSKTMETLILPRHLLSVEDGAVRSCTSLETIYFPDGVYAITDNALDQDSYRNLKNFYVNASICPRFSANDEGGYFSVKLSRLLASEDKNRLIVISGSSSYLGLSTEYLEALLENKYRVINFGTTRTTHGTMYLEAMRRFAHEGDIVVYAPENSSYMFGETELYWKTIRDMEGMYNIFRYVDISNYKAVLSSFADFNKTYRYKRLPSRYENMCTIKYGNKYGDRIEDGMAKYYDESEYSDSYYVTLNTRIKSKFDTVPWGNVEYHQNNRDYDNPDNNIWCSIDQPYMLELMNAAIDSAKSSGAKVYFGFAPTDAQSVVPASRNLEALAEYERTIMSLYHFDGLLGNAKNYIFERKYFHDCAYHTNDYGRVYRTYRVYLDFAELVDIKLVNGILSRGQNFEGCLFEPASDGTPVTKVGYLEQ